MIGYNLFKIIHLSSLVVLSGLILTGGVEQKVTRWKWFLIFVSSSLLGISGFLLLSNLGFFSTHWPFWVILKIVGFIFMMIIGLMGLKKLWSEKTVFYLWMIFSIAMIVISVKKFYY